MFESSDKSGLNNGRKLRLDISNINQSGLKGDTVYTVTMTAPGGG